MIVNMSRNATQEQIDHVVERIKECGYQAHVIRGAERTVIGAVGSSGRRGELEALQAAPGVEELVPISQPFKLVSRQLRQERSVVHVGGVPIGGEQYVVMAGPCSVESREQLLATARAVRDAGGSILRGGAYKPRTSPYDFQGLGVEALELLKEAREETGLPIVTEVMSTEDVDVVSEYADMLQVGARNMQNFPLLRRLARVEKPILLKRGPSATVKEWLLAAEYLLTGGNPNVVLCERGIKTFESGVAQYFRSSRHTAGQRVIASAGGRRSFPRHGPAQRDSGDEPRGDCRGRRRHHDRSASVPGARAFRRATVARFEGVRAIDGRAGSSGKNAFKRYG